ncbi:Pyruvate decarboxylase 2 [Sesamum angolense]|uniref:pyruvate decarboxylase n=1 Tax=Sesamum angolense TaxID=2727404 RepID=A0AAE2C6S7_9LAMI|nr:Pyruvate decarboxylase 2 [Sesamum angolense]
MIKTSKKTLMKTFEDELTVSSSVNKFFLGENKSKEKEGYNVKGSTTPRDSTQEVQNGKLQDSYYSLVTAKKYQKEDGSQKVDGSMYKSNWKPTISNCHKTRYYVRHKSAIKVYAESEPSTLWSKKDSKILTRISGRHEKHIRLQFSLGSGIFSWACQETSYWAQSSAEAEYIAAAATSNQAIWLRRILEDIGEKQEEPTTIYCDNKSAITITKNPVQHSRTKHIDIKYHSLREATIRGEIELKYCSTEEQLADIFTKANQEQFEELRMKIDRTRAQLDRLLQRAQMLATLPTAMPRASRCWRMRRDVYRRSLSILNAIGAYSENLPVICIVGGPNSNDYGTNRILHHTIGLPDFSQELHCFRSVTCYQAVVNNLEDAHELIDTAISTALKESKPVYISISCNLPAIPHPTFSLMPSAKGLVPEDHPHFIGTYWGAVSTAFCAKIVESADAYLFVGPIFNDYSSVRYSLLLKKEKAIIVQPDRVIIGDGPTFGCVLMKDFLIALGKRLKPNATAYENYHRIFVPDGHPLKSEPNEALRVNVLFQHIQKMLSAETAIVAETGDSWFNCQKLKLPKGCGYEFQMQYGSIGWSVGATLGYAQALPDKRVIACIGDGSFQMTAQDLSTMIRCGQKSIIFLINNGGYTIEVEIHDGPYNVIKNWNYTALVDAIHNGEGNCWTTKVRCEEELIEAIKNGTEAKKDCLCFIEVIVHKDDTSKELLEWGSRVSAANSRPPNPR